MSSSENTLWIVTISLPSLFSVEFLVFSKPTSAVYVVRTLHACRCVYTWHSARRRKLHSVGVSPTTWPRCAQCWDEETYFLVFCAGGR